MRSTRDTQMSDMAQLKAQVKDQNQRLVQLSQEKAKLDAKTKVGENESIQFSNKQVCITLWPSYVQDFSIFAKQII